MSEVAGVPNANSFRDPPNITSDTLVLQTYIMPDNGWIIKYAIHAGGLGVTSSVQHVFYNYAQRALIWKSDHEAWLPGRAWHEAATPAIPLARSTVFYGGFFRDLNLPVEWSIQTTAGLFHTAQNATGSEPPEISSPGVTYPYALTSYIEWVRNEAPLKGAWRQGSPSGTLSRVDPTYSGTLPHPGTSSQAIVSGSINPGYQGDAVILPGNRSISFAGVDDNAAVAGPRGVFATVPPPSPGKRHKGKKGHTVMINALEAANLTIRAAADDQYDYTTRIQLTIYDYTNPFAPTTAYDQQFEPTDQEIAQGYFSRQAVNLTPGRTYYAYFRHMDYWGIWSPWSDAAGFTVEPAPDPPATALSPVGKVASGIDFPYRATYTHPNNYQAIKVQVEIYNETGSVLLYASPEIAINAVNRGGSVQVNHSQVTATPLIAGRGYTFRMRIQDNAPTPKWGGWSTKFPFSINAVPYIPSNLSPSGARGTSQLTLIASVNDPDRDLIQQVKYELYQVSNGALIRSGNMIVAADGRTATFDLRTVTPLPVTDNTAYMWRAQAYDGLQWSDWSGYAQFIYQQVPAITLVAPKWGGVINPIAQPSAEYDPAIVGAWWEDMNADGSNYINRVTDGDAAVGKSAWEAVTSGKVDFYRRSPLIQVDPTKPRALLAEFRTKIGTPKVLFRLACYDNSGTFLSYVVPSSDGALNSTQPTASFSRYGGIVGPNGNANFAKQYPANTASVRIEVYPSAVAGQAGTVRFDAFFFPEIPTASDANWLLVRGMYGYIDPDVPYYSQKSDRSWDGAIGNSQSRGAAIMDQPSSYFEFTYSSPASRAKSDDRIELQKWSGKEWGLVYSNVYAGVGGNRTVIPLPTSAVTNEGRYRLRVFAKDSFGLEGVSEWVEFDVDYEGPNQLAILQASPDPASATITLNHVASDLDPLQFVRKEVQRIHPDGTIIHYVDNDPTNTTFIDHFPESGTEYVYRIRQIQLLGTQQVEGRWSTVRASVDYFPVFFLKSVKDPERYRVSFYILWSAKPTSKPVRNVALYEVWGSEVPKYALSPQNYEQGTLSMALFDSPEFTQGQDEKLALMEEMLDDMGIMCLLTHKPTKRRFVQITEGPELSINDTEDYVLPIAWSEAFYLEDYYEREEARTSAKIVWDEIY